jgi:hypothetical protein
MSGTGSAPKAAACELMSAFLAKPFQPETLLPLIHRVLHEPAPSAAPHPAPVNGAESVVAAGNRRARRDAAPPVPGFGF